MCTIAKNCAKKHHLYADQCGFIKLKNAAETFHESAQSLVEALEKKAQPGRLKALFRGHIDSYNGLVDASNANHCSQRLSPKVK